MKNKLMFALGTGIVMTLGTLSITILADRYHRNIQENNR